MAISEAQLYAQENNLHITEQVGKEWNWEEIDGAVDGQQNSLVDEAELLEFIMQHGEVIREYASAVVRELMAYGFDGQVTFAQLQKGLDQYSDYTAIMVRDVSVDNGQGEDSVERRGGDFTLYLNEETNTYQWAIRAADGRYYDVTGTTEGGSSANDYWNKYRNGDVGIEFDPAREVPIESVFRPSKDDAQKLEQPPPFSTNWNPENGPNPQNGSWFLTDGVYVFVENKRTTDDQDPYLDVYLYDSQGKMISAMTGDPHVNEAGGNAKWDWHYSDGSRFQVGDFLLDVETTDLGNANEYNTQVNLRTGDNRRFGMTVEADGAVRDTSNSAPIVNQRSKSLFDTLDFGNISGHMLAFLVFLESSEVLDGVLGDVLEGLTGRNANINQIREIYSSVTGISADKFEGDRSKEKSMSYDEFAVLVHANQVTGGRNKNLNNYYVKVGEGGQRVIVNRATDKVIDKANGPFPSGWDDHRKLNKDQVEAISTALEQAMQEQTGEVELVMTRVKNFLTKREAFVSATGSVTGGLGKMLDRVN